MVVEPTKPHPPVTRILAPPMSICCSCLLVVGAVVGVVIQREQKVRGIAAHTRIRRNVPDDVAADTDEGAVTDPDPMHDAGPAADIAVLADGYAACDRDSGADQAPIPHHG